MSGFFSWYVIFWQIREWYSWTNPVIRIQDQIDHCFVHYYFHNHVSDGQNRAVYWRWSHLQTLDTICFVFVQFGSCCSGLISSLIQLSGVRRCSAINNTVICCYQCCGCLERPALFKSLALFTRVFARIINTKTHAGDPLSWQSNKTSHQGGVMGINMDIYGNTLI